MKTSESSSDGASFVGGGQEGPDDAVGPVPTDKFRLYIRGEESVRFKQEEILVLASIPETSQGALYVPKSEDQLQRAATAVEEFLGPNVATGSTPSMRPWPGDRLFGFRIDPPKMAKDPQFSSVLGKVFLNMNQPLDILFSYVPCDNLFLRAVLVFTEDNYLRVPVDVCPKHLECHSEIQGHLLRCSSELESFYGEDGGRHYVIVRLPNRQGGSEEVSVGFLFADLNSCLGGINRRDVAVVFTLELYGEVIGRLVLPLRVCTSPKRDLRVEENQVLRKEPVRIEEEQTMIPTKRKYWVLANGEDNYKTLCSIGEVLEKKDSGNIKQWKAEVTSFNLTKDPKNPRT